MINCNLNLNLNIRYLKLNVLQNPPLERKMWWQFTHFESLIAHNWMQSEA